VAPDIGTVVSYEDREVTDDGDPPFVAVSLEVPPFPEELELDELLKAHFFGVGPRLHRPHVQGAPSFASFRASKSANALSHSA